MIELSKDKIIERFRSYVALDTASDDKSETSPSTAKQLKLAKLLKSELSGLGLEDVVLTEYGYVLAALPANTNEKRLLSGCLLIWIPVMKHRERISKCRCSLPMTAVSWTLAKGLN